MLFAQCYLLLSASSYHLSLDTTPIAEGLAGTSGEAKESKVTPQGCREWAPSTVCEPWPQRLRCVKARHPQWSNSVSLNSVTWALQSLPAVWILHRKASCSVDSSLPEAAATSCLSRAT